MQLPKVAVLIVTYNSEQDIPRLFQSLALTDYPCESVFVYITDNHSQDATQEILKRYAGRLPFQYTLVWNDENLGFDIANNNLYELAKNKHHCDYVVALNPDTEVEKNWLKELINCAESNPRAGAVQSLLLLTSDRKKINSAGNALCYLGIGYVSKMGERADDLMQQSASTIGFASGAAVCYRESVLKKTGLFYPDFFYMEDVDLSWRIKLLGYDVLACPQSFIWHNYRYSKGLYKMKAIELNRHKALLQNYKIATLLVLFPVLLLFEIIVFAASVAQGWWKEKCKNYFEIFAYLPVMKERRKRVMASRIVSDRSIMKQMSLTIHFPNGDPAIVTYLINPLFVFYGWIVRTLMWW